MPNFTIKTVDTKADKLRFIKSQWNFYKGDKNFVAPMIMDRKKVLDTEKNPFYQHSKLKLFIAERDNQVVGRIAAIINDNHNITHEDKVGFFGFFECENNQEIANALLKSAEEWLRANGMSDIRGPINPSMNDEVGLLIDGFDKPPVTLMTYNPQYYMELIDKAGYAKVKDLNAYWMVYENYMSEKLGRLVEAVRERNKITIRQVDFKNKTQFAKDVQTLKDLYNMAWEKNWGFVKMTEAEFDFLAADLKSVAAPEICFIAETEGKPCGFVIALPDINQILINNKKGGLLGAAYQLIFNKKKINAMRIIVLGVLKEYRKTGIDALLYWEVANRGLTINIDRGEGSWILEDNDMMNRALTNIVKGDLYKRYRIYQKAL